LAGRGVDLAIDSIAGRFPPQVIETLGDQEKVSLVGRLASTVPEVNTAVLFFQGIRLGGVALNAYSNTESRSAGEMWIENGLLRRPPTQTGQADLPHPTFQVVVPDGLAQALDFRASEESRQPRRLAPRSLVVHAVRCRVGVES
jgi:hypothetical protein